jgi:putative ABC transport system permease protein
MVMRAVLPASLAWRMLTRQRARFVMTLVGVAVAVFLIVFQGSLLVGFVTAAGRIITASEADVWIVPRGVPCFDFAARLPRRYLDLAMQVEGVREAIPMVAGFTTLQRPDGRRQAVLIVGADRRIGGEFPLPVTGTGDEAYLLREGLAIDESNAAFLGVETLPASVEVAGHRAEVVRAVSGFGTFLGSPYVFGLLGHVRTILGMPDEQVSFGLVRFDRAPDTSDVDALRRRLPDADVLTSIEFTRQSSRFWLVQTGAGGAILVAALLGLIVGLVIVLQTMYANVVESVSEFATLKALGASPGAIRRFIATQAVIMGVLGSACGLLLLDPVASLAREHLVTWVVTPVWLRAIGALLGVAIACCAALSAATAATRIDPVRVLRG